MVCDREKIFLSNVQIMTRDTFHLAIRQENGSRERRDRIYSPRITSEGIIVVNADGVTGGPSIILTLTLMIPHPTTALHTIHTLSSHYHWLWYHHDN